MHLVKNYHTSRAMYETNVGISLFVSLYAHMRPDVCVCVKLLPVIKCEFVSCENVFKACYNISG